MPLTPPPVHADSNVAPPPKKATLLQVVRIVLSMLFMIGRNRDYGPDAPTIGPGRLIIVAIVGAALLIGGLVFLASHIAR